MMARVAAFGVLLLACQAARAGDERTAWVGKFGPTELSYGFKKDAAGEWALCLDGIEVGKCEAVDVNRVYIEFQPKWKKGYDRYRVYADRVEIPSKGPYSPWVIAAKGKWQR